MPPRQSHRGYDLLCTSLGFDLGRVLDVLRPTEPGEFRVPVRRPDDLLIFDLVFENLHLVKGAPPRLGRKVEKRAAMLIVELPPQSFGEQVFLQIGLEPEAGDESVGEVSKDPGYPKKNAPTTEAEPVPILPSAKIRMSGRSRLAYAMPSDQESLAFTLEAILEAMRTWPLRLDVGAGPDFGSNFAVAPQPGGGLSRLSESASWLDTRDDLIESLTALGARGIESAIDVSAQRVAERAAAGIVAGGRECLAPVLQEVFHQQVDELTRRYEQLREGPAREAGIAALALATTEMLTSSVDRITVDIDVISRLPFLPLLLAPHEVPRTVTALELPYRLLMSPIETARFLHRGLPFEHSGRTELWHTRMTTGKDDFGPDLPGKARALWSPDYSLGEITQQPDEEKGEGSDDQPVDMLTVLGPPPKPFRMPLDPLDRQMLVKLMAGYDKFQKESTLRYVPRPSRVDRLHLSALGGLLDAEGNWDVRPEGVDLQQWRHQATLGRDHYVRVVYVGFLCPLGHAASLVKVTERKFEPLPNTGGKRVAVLRQRFFIVVREQVRTYSGANHQFKGRNFPFNGIELLTRTTPDLLAPGASAVVELPGQPIYGTIDGTDVTIAKRMVFWPMLQANNDFRFEIAATDLSGQRVTFSLPLLFVGEIANQHKAGPIRNAYNHAGTVQKRFADLGGASVTYAPFDSEDDAKGDPRLPTSEMTFNAGELTNHFARAPNFYPETESASVGIPPLQKLLGQHDAVVEVKYPPEYKQAGFNGANPGEVFLQLATPYSLNFGGESNQARSDALGALASPQMQIQGLSRVMGPVASSVPEDPTKPLQNAINNDFNPTDFFDGAKILGGIDLSDILVGVHSLAGPDVPKLLSREFTDRIETSFTWDTPIAKPDPLNLLIPNADGNRGTQLSMNGLVTTPIASPNDSDFQAQAELTNFKINLFGFVIIWFENIQFHAQKGHKPDVTISLREGSDSVRFGGPLEFVNALQEVIPSNGFSDPPSIEVTPSGISAGYSLTLPALEVGVFTLSNLSLGASFNLPFDSRPASVRFNFSKRESPFSLTVSLLGGGGFVAIAISSRGVNEIETALEYGAVVAINLGVASGSVEEKAGIYMHWLEPVPDNGSVELAGYVRIQGEFSVLGLISLGLTFNLQLGFVKEFDKASGKARATVCGEATLTVEVELLLFSASVEVTCRREFVGSDKVDPKFIDLVPNEDVWTEYCEAFAAETV